MGSCTRRHFLLSTCFLQMITIIERQVFDFLGYMWAPIFVNFCQIICIIFGFYGAYHFRFRYILTYLIWSFIWIGWNAFLICFYLNVGVLDRDSDLLNLGTGSVSWFEVNGYGCKPIYPSNITSDDPFRPLRPERVDDCLLDYTMIEVIQSGVQCALAILGILGAILISYLFRDDDDRLKHAKKSKSRQSLYSIEFATSIDTIRSRTDTILDYDDHTVSMAGELCPKPMTPRRVKRRSVMARGSNGRQSTASRRSGRERDRGDRDSGGSSHTGTHSRSSMRSSRRKYHQNPVTKLLDQQMMQQTHSHHHHHHQHQHAAPSASTSKQQQFGSFHHHHKPLMPPPPLPPPPLTATNLESLNLENNIVAASSSSLSRNTNYHRNIPPDPIYYNTNAQTGIYRQSWQSNSTSPQSPLYGSDGPASPASPISNTAVATGGHYNPTYQHSSTNLNLDTTEHVDELYNNRPPSVRSSYSNFHGTRPLSSYLAASSNAENVFVGLTSGQQQTTSSYNPPSTPPLYQQHSRLHQHSPQPSLNLPLPSPNTISGVGVGGGPTYTTPSLPQQIPFAKRTASRESIRSMAFLNSGPPAYNLNYHTPPDSETTM